jgi:hypothetical protein
MTQLAEDAFVPLLKRDVAATVGAKYERLVDRNASRLLPFRSAGHIFAARVIDDVQQELHDTFVDTTWPHCPTHPHHPLWFEDGAWRCAGGSTFIAPLGELDVALLHDALAGLKRGDFSRLTPLFFARGDARSRQLAVARRLIESGAPLETINMHGTTVLGTAVWSAVNEPRAEHRAIIEALLDAGAAVGASGYPSGNAEVDRLLERFGAGVAG